MFHGADERLVATASEGVQVKNGVSDAVLGLSSVHVVLALSLAWPSGPAEAIELRLPINCEIGVTCEVQNYVDLDPSSQARDYQCGSRTYNGHKGVDFRLPSLRAQRAGVNVLAAAQGRVLKVRDGVPDMSVRERGIGAVNDRECGNGVVVDHGEGWSTQYCHMAQGSLLVKPGDKVEASQDVGTSRPQRHDRIPAPPFRRDIPG